MGGPRWADPLVVQPCSTFRRKVKRADGNETEEVIALTPEDIAKRQRRRTRRGRRDNGAETELNAMMPGPRSLVLWYWRRGIQPEDVSDARGDKFFLEWEIKRAADYIDKYLKLEAVECCVPGCTRTPKYKNPPTCAACDTYQRKYGRDPSPEVIARRRPPRSEQ